MGDKFGNGALFALPWRGLLRRLGFAAGLMLSLAGAAPPDPPSDPHGMANPHAMQGVGPMDALNPHSGAPAEPEQIGDAVPAKAEQAALVKATYAYFKLKDSGDYARAYEQIAPSMRDYLTPDLFRSAAATFNAEAGPVEQRRIVRLTWERDPAGASRPGLYVAADFTARFPNIAIMCGYVMWRQDEDGRFRIVREEQSFVDTQTIQSMVPERRKTLPNALGCVTG